MPDQNGRSTITRRRLLQGAALAGAGSAVYGFVRWKQPVSRAKAKVVIVGGGAAGLSIAARLSRALAEPDITLIDPASQHYYQPGFTMIAVGVFDAGSVVRPQASLVPDGVAWMQDRVTGLEPDRNRVITAQHGSVPYDFLVLCPGLQMHFEGIEGLRQQDLGQGNVHCIYDYQSAQKCWTAIERLAETGGRAYFTDTWTKLKCGGAPKKINMMAEDYCRRKGVRGRVDIQLFTASDHLFEVPLFRKRLEEIYAERSIPITYNHRVKAVDTSARKVTLEKRAGDQIELVTRDFDFLHVVPPMSAPDFVKASPLAFDSKTGKTADWVPTNPATLVHARYRNVCVAGDVAGIPTSKTAAAIRMQAPVVAANLIALMENRAPDARYDGYTACPFVTEYGKVLMAEFGYDKKPAPSLPLVDPGHEHRPGWMLKRYVLKPMYFDLMLRGLA
ncbi:MAG TPA: FAD/NAD(P)-binding oxidoreductase [Bryobacteraceae bacterium]|nr:FAD/NAD(P)-binding oxidoreductase [Bryobacteraceae bacterium]